MRDIEPFGSNHYEMKWCKGRSLDIDEMTGWYFNYESRYAGYSDERKKERLGVFVKSDSALPAN